MSGSVTGVFFAKTALHCRCRPSPFAAWAPWRNQLPGQASSTNQPRPNPRTAGCTSESISSDAKGETVSVNVPSNWRKRSSPLSNKETPP